MIDRLRDDIGHTGTQRFVGMIRIAIHANHYHRDIDIIRIATQRAIVRPRPGSVWETESSSFKWIAAMGHTELQAESVPSDRQGNVRPHRGAEKRSLIIFLPLFFFAAWAAQHSNPSCPWGAEHVSDLLLCTPQYTMRKMKESVNKPNVLAGG